MDDSTSDEDLLRRRSKNNTQSLSDSDSDQKLAENDEIHNRGPNSHVISSEVNLASKSHNSDIDSDSKSQTVSHKTQIGLNHSSNAKSSEDKITMFKEPQKPPISDSDSDTIIYKSVSRKTRIQLNNNSDSDDSSCTNMRMLGKELNKTSSGSDSDTSIFKSVARKSRIRINNNSDSDNPSNNSNIKAKNPEGNTHNSDTETDLPTNINSKFKSGSHNSQIQSNSSSEDSSNKKQESRTNIKRNKMLNKFKKLKSSRGLSRLEKKSDDEGSESNKSDDDLASIENIKKIIKERMSSFNSSICDPDTSDEEDKLTQIYKKRKERKTKMISPKPQRMSAKQAMENMHKIKSESNRMLREKEVSLPYHRPKALSLKDIMSRRQPALSSDGKTLPIKMNEKQLQQYAQMLEERQKKMSELWQSESDEDDNDSKDTQTTDTHNLIDDKTPNDIETGNPIEESAVPNIVEVLVDALISNTETQSPNTIESEKDTTTNKEENNSEVEINNEPHNKTVEEQDSETNLKLVYNDSYNDAINNDTIEEDTDAADEVNKDTTHCYKEFVEIVPNKDNTKEIGTKNDNIDDIKELLAIESNTNVISDVKLSTEVNTEEQDTEAMVLQYDSEFITVENESDDKIDAVETKINDDNESNVKNKTLFIETEALDNDSNEAMDIDKFSDDELNLDDIENIIENAEIMRDIEDKVNSPLLIRDIPLNVKPKLTGAPGMVIDLDGINPSQPKKTGVQLLKERFTYFAKLKTPEESEREKEKRLKPGTLHIKLKQELEEKMAEQRSMEWAKRLEEEKQQHDEIKALRGDESDEGEGDGDDLDKIEAKLQTEEQEDENESCEEEEELVEDDVEIKDKPRAKNVMIADEADESDCEDDNQDAVENDDVKNEDCDEKDDDDESDGDDDDDESDSESESEEEQTSNKKGRILKAFEDSDDEEASKTEKLDAEVYNDSKMDTAEKEFKSLTASQDDEIQLAQRQSVSDDLFTSQESSGILTQAKDISKECSSNENDLGTQTFSILDSTKAAQLVDSANETGLDKESDINGEFGAVLPGTFTQNILPLPSSQVSASQSIGDDVLALCTGNFYDNQFVSQSEIDKQGYDSFDDENEETDDTQKVSSIADEKNDEEFSTTKDTEATFIDKSDEKDCDSFNNVIGDESIQKVPTDEKSKTEGLEASRIIEKEATAVEENKDVHSIVDNNLKSILDELSDPKFDSPKPNKFFTGNNKVQTDSQVKKKFIIDSDDESKVEQSDKKKKLKKKKAEKRALHFSDDEEDEIDQNGDEYYESDVEQEEPGRIVEYDSEENEIEIKSDNPKKKRKMADFFEQEAELTSEDEWIGSGDENEAGLDRMEREEGDDDVFHQGKLQRELGQIHMRDVLDQDKREVRMIQELLFEDGDLGAGSRQRKFRWNNIEGGDENGVLVDEFADTQEDLESEEQWRKQRHEREMFLRQMQNKDENTDSHNVSINRTTIIKANLNSKTMSSLLLEVKSKNENTETTVVVEKKTVKDIPSPKKPFAMLQQGYVGSFLNRGRGSLARLAALATPLAVHDEDKLATIPTTAKRNFVFATLTPQQRSKVSTKRKAETNPGTPKLLKKMKTEEKTSRSSLLDKLNM